MNLRRGLSSGRSLTWWNIPCISPLIATAYCRNWRRTPSSEAPRVGPGSNCWLRETSWYAKEQLKTSLYLPLGVSTQALLSIPEARQNGFHSSFQWWSVWSTKEWSSIVPDYHVIVQAELLFQPLKTDSLITCRIYLSCSVCP